MKLDVISIVALCLLVLVMAGLEGCSYAGIATASDGTLYVTRNDEGLLSFGSNRTIFICKPSGDRLNCKEAVDRP